jgi:hypothetical protein
VSFFSFAFLFGYGNKMAPPSRISAADSRYILYLMDIGAVTLIVIVCLFVCFSHKIAVRTARRS